MLSTPAQTVAAVYMTAPASIIGITSHFLSFVVVVVHLYLLVLIERTDDLHTIDALGIAAGQPRSEMFRS
jgi:hypothetical protein